MTLEERGCPETGGGRGVGHVVTGAYVPISCCTQVMGGGRFSMNGYLGTEPLVHGALAKAPVETARLFQKQEVLSFCKDHMP